jgi:hypothetical protein
LDAGRLGEGVEQRHEGVVLGLHEIFPRSMDSCAPGSGFHGAVCAQALAQSSKAGPVSAPAAASAVPL